MSPDPIEVIKPGAQSQLQDLGRHGWQHLGVPVGGAMDELSHRVANLLLGNACDAATLEIVLMGPTLRFGAATQVALCGADLSATLDGQPLPRNRCVDVPAGALLAFGQRVNGLRCYLAVRGGFAVAPVLGSRSTFVRGGFGGHLGRALRKGDWLPVAGPAEVGAASSGSAGSAGSAGSSGSAGGVGGLGASDAQLRDIPQQLVVWPQLPDPTPGQVTTIRVTLGAHWGLFSAAAQALFTQAPYQLSPQSDRMGYRLAGPALERLAPAELISEGVDFGTIQVPPDGQPIVLMAERQSTGGYPKIGQVIGVDLPLLAQLAPQQALRFAPISLQAAQTLYLQRELALAPFERDPTG